MRISGELADGILIGIALGIWIDRVVFPWFAAWLCHRGWR